MYESRRWVLIFKGLSAQSSAIYLDQVKKSKDFGVDGGRTKLSKGSKFNVKV